MSSLLATGSHTITALTRKDSKATFPDGVKSIPIDYDADEEALVSALQGQQFLIITLSVSASPDIQGKLFRAAVKAGVDHVMPNVYTCDIVLSNQALGDEVMIRGMQAPVIQDIESLGGKLAYTVLVCGLWQEFSLAAGSNFFGLDLSKREVTFADQGERRINTSTWSQLGRAVAAFLSLKVLPDDENDTTSTIASFRDKPLYVSSFHVSQREMFDSVKRVTGTTDADWTVKHETSEERIADGRKQFAQGNMLGMAKAYYTRMFSAEGQVAVYQDKLHNEMLGLPEDGLDEATRTAVKMSEAGFDPHQ